MKPLNQFIQRLSTIFKRLGICATVGFIAGMITGVMLQVQYLETGSAVLLTNAETWQVALLLAAFCFIAMLFLLYALGRYSLSSVVLPTLVNCILTSFLTVFLVNKLGAWKLAVFIGMLVGLLVGYLLCLLCRYLLKDGTHGLYRA